MYNRPVNKIWKRCISKSFDKAMDLMDLIYCKDTPSRENKKFRDENSCKVKQRQIVFNYLAASETIEWGIKWYLEWIFKQRKRLTGVDVCLKSTIFLFYQNFNILANPKHYITDPQKYMQYLNNQNYTLNVLLYNSPHCAICKYFVKSPSVKAFWNMTCSENDAFWTWKTLIINTKCTKSRRFSSCLWMRDNALMRSVRNQGWIDRILTRNVTQLPNW